MKRVVAGLSVWAIVLGSAALGADAVRVRVAAGDSDRVGTPVFADLDQSGVSPATPVLVRGADGAIVPGQIEPLEDGKTRVWWIVDELAAGQSREYSLQLGKSAPGESFRWKDDPDKSMDLLLGDRPVLRYMYAPFDRNDIEGTKKPFHHVFDPEGGRPITKGGGGLYPHHRGIFFGYNKCTIDGGTFDVWHAAKGEHQVHRRVLGAFGGPVAGGHVLEIDWNDRAGVPFARETRVLIAYRQPAGHQLIEFLTTLVPTRGPVKLAGDRQHAGVQFRAAQDVAGNQARTRYLRPDRWKGLPTDKEENGDEYKDLPWNAVQYPLGERDYTVAYLSDPKNPDGAGFSERLYGRFGEYFPYELTEEKPLRARYRWWITTDASVSRDDIQDRFLDLANPPKVTLVK